MSQPMISIMGIRFTPSILMRPKGTIQAYLHDVIWLFHGAFLIKNIVLNDLKNIAQALV